MLVTSRAEEYMLAVIGELELVPASAESILPALGIREHVECGEWLPVKVTEVIKENSLGCWRCDCKDIAGRVPSGQVCAMKVQLAAGILGRGVPDAESVIFTAGKKIVLTWMKRETRDVLFVALKVPQIRVVMGGEITDCVCKAISRLLTVAGRKHTVLLCT